jgi:hypothetical protein
MKKPTVKLITFGGGSVEYREAAERLIAQSKEFPSIDERRSYTEADLPPDYHELFNGVSSIATGCGLYSWKPYLINAELSSLAQNDILIYIDAGCELNGKGIRRFNDYLSYTSKNDILLFEQQHPNRFWTKYHPKLLGYPEHFFRNTLVAGVFFLKNNERTKQLIKAWLDLCAYENGVLLRDPEDNEPQLPGFIKHRHDQSCLSVCAYLHNMATIPDETWFPDWSEAGDYPILALRNRTGISVLNEKMKKNIFKKIKIFRL